MSGFQSLAGWIGLVSLYFYCCIKSRSWVVQSFCLLRVPLIIPLWHAHCTSPGQSCDPAPGIPGRGTSSSRAASYTCVDWPQQALCGSFSVISEPKSPSTAEPASQGHTAPNRAHWVQPHPYWPHIPWERAWKLGPPFLKAEALGLKFLFSQGLWFLVHRILTSPCLIRKFAESSVGSWGPQALLVQSPDSAGNLRSESSVQGLFPKLFSQGTSMFLSLVFLISILGLMITPSPDAHRDQYCLQ